jgi:hypothetical protein
MPGTGPPFLPASAVPPLGLFQSKIQTLFAQAKRVDTRRSRATLSIHCAIELHIDQAIIALQQKLHAQFKAI